VNHAVDCAFVAPERGARGRTAVATVAALLAHGALIALAFNHSPAARALVTTTEVELLPPAPPPAEPPPPSAPEPEPVKPVVARAPRAPRAPAPVEPEPPPAAAAAPLRVAEENAKVSSEPVRFVTDPNGASFGYGAVARGGSGAGAGSSGPRVEGPAPSSLAEPGSLSRPPRLQEREPCRGFFPPTARVDRGEVALKLRVERDGSVRSLTVEREEPLGQGFGFAARDCLRSKRFSPALNRAGQPVAVMAPISVRFSR
jgi:periplasmic protein TonB